ncbi:MAG: phospholipase D family protein [Tepidisphaeraceae bacterium]|jgi:hypothetical protein
MAKYLDSGVDADRCAGRWLDENLVPGILGLRAQFGYFRYNAIAPFANTIRTASAAGHPVHFALGSNAGSLAAVDVQRLIRIVSGRCATVTVVAFAGAEFHPKTIHVAREDGSTTALVGSSNLTENGLGVNVEASIVLDDLLHDEHSRIQEVAEAAERWKSINIPGVYPIETDADIQALVDSQIINVPQPSRPSAEMGLARRSIALGRRRRSWTARTAGRGPQVRFDIPPLIEVPAPLPVLLHNEADIAELSQSIISHKWCKELKSSDAQQVKPGSNPTGKLRLTQSGFPIDHKKWFREEMFGDAVWRTLEKNGKPYEQATIPFSVRVRGEPFGIINLDIDHAPHRIAGQGNVPTILAWGHTIERMLIARNFIGDWVAVTRDATGAFTLTIQSRRPTWR